MADDRFKRLFTDKEFQIDQTTDAYKLLKSGNVNKKVKNDDVDSIKSGESEDEKPAGVKSRDLNKLFSGKGEESESADEESEEGGDFQSKMNKK
jgi:hypothetical protein